MNEDRVEEVRGRSNPESDIVEIRRPATVIAFPSARVSPARSASTPTCQLLAQTALDLARSSEHGLARRAARDALKLTESLLGCEEPNERAAVARALLTTGEAFLLLHEMHRAKDCFETASGLFDRDRELAGAAQARVGLANALRA
ncbi:MAG TPA: hypothetical protein VM925_37035, partial [Labilithrix sp.]|nr:hypothetical protein [Labilithrix sp.]